MSSINLLILGKLLVDFKEVTWWWRIGIGSSPFTNDFWGDRFFNQLVPRHFTDFFRTGNFGPSIDLRETENEVILQADLPGVNREDLDDG